MKKFENGDLVQIVNSRTNKQLIGQRGLIYKSGVDFAAIELCTGRLFGISTRFLTAVIDTGESSNSGCDHD
jgi:hypothetical protein